MNTAKLTIIALVALLAASASSRVSASPQAAGDKPENHVVQAKDAAVKGAKVVGEKTKDGLSKTGEVMTDGWITTRVKSRFVGQRLLKGSDIDVDTDKHVVTLTGTVANAAGRSRAAVIAKGTEGVSRVVNRLTIGPRT
jgi:hyperosmotically inducible periplasmic protein